MVQDSLRWTILEGVYPKTSRICPACVRSRWSNAKIGNWKTLHLSFIYLLFINFYTLFQ